MIQLLFFIVIVGQLQLLSLAQLSSALRSKATHQWFVVAAGANCYRHISRPGRRILSPSASAPALSSPKQRQREAATRQPLWCLLLRQQLAWPPLPPLCLQTPAAARAHLRQHETTNRGQSSTLTNSGEKINGPQAAPATPFCSNYTRAAFGNCFLSRLVFCSSAAPVVARCSILILFSEALVGASQQPARNGTK